MAELGTAPPHSAPDHPDWVNNPWVIVYGADGSVLHRLELPVSGWAQITAIGDSRYIIDGGGPVRLQRIGGGETEEIAVTMPTPEPGRGTGHSRRVPEYVCPRALDLRRPTRSFPESGSSLQVFRHQVDETASRWDLVGTIDYDDARSATFIRCTPTRDDLIVSNEWIMSTTTGLARRMTFSPPAVDSVMELGLIDDMPVGLDSHYPSRTVLRLDDDVWRPIGEIPEGRWGVVVFGNRLVDISGALQQLPAANAVVPIDF